MDAGLVSWLGSISGKVWIDNDSDGTRTLANSSWSAVTVRLLDASFNEVDSVETDSNGDYSFADVVPGDYYVDVVEDLSFVFTAQDTGSDDTIDSDIDPATGMSAVISLGANQDLDDLDAGLLFPGSISGQVWEDTDADGIRDCGETGVAGIWVDLYDPFLNLVASTQTDSNGEYGFFNMVPAGNYYTIQLTSQDP